MIDNRPTVGKDCVKEHIIEIGQDLIKNAEKISEEIDGVREIKISAILTPDEIIHYDVTKSYGVNAIIHNKEE